VVDRPLLEAEVVVQPVDSDGQVPLLMVVASQDEVRIGKILLVDIGPEDALGTLRSTSVSVVVVNVKPTLRGAVPVRRNNQPPGITPPRARPGGGWIVELNPDALPRVLVNNQYHAVLSSRAKDRTEKTYISEQFQSANWLVRSLRVAGEAERADREQAVIDRMEAVSRR